MSFWDELYSRGRPVIGMSPMDGVTDAPFRAMVAKYGRPDVIFTEFVSVDGLHFAQGEKKERMLREFVKARDLIAKTNTMVESVNEGKEEVDIQIKENAPFEVAQVFGNKPEFFIEAARLVESLGFDGIDINMGCPAKNVSENGCGAGLIRTPELAQEIVRATMGATKLPVSVKTRIGVSSASEMEEWIKALIEVRPANISLHGRTLKQLYQGSADWEAIGRAARMVQEAGLHLLGNGDVASLMDAKEKIDKYGVNGVLIGRAAEGNPEIFVGNDDPIQDTRLEWAVEHAKLYETLFKPSVARDDDIRWFLPMRKHLAWYAHGFPKAVELRMALMRTRSADEVEIIIADFKKN